MDNIFLKVIELVVIIAVTLIMRYGILLLKTWAEEMKLTGVMKWVAKAVEAAEQTNKKAGSGAEKKAIVTEFLKEILTAKNISISDAQLETLIEAAVFAMNNSKGA